MGRRALAAWLVALAMASLAGCGELAWERGRVLLWWEAHEMLFALSPQRARLDAYRLHGGVLWTGGLALPAEECFGALRFDPASARLWLLGEAGGMLVDARRMEVLARWRGDEPPAGPPPTALSAQSDTPSLDACAGRRLARGGAPASGARPAHANETPAGG
jgi:hypothetical protein